MTTAQAQTILDMLRGFAALERPATDEAGWVALKLSCSRSAAEKKIREARAKNLAGVAPDLLERLQELITQVEMHGSDDLVNHLHAELLRAKQAIGRATGGEPPSA